MNRIFMLAIFGMLLNSAAPAVRAQNIEKGKESFKTHGCTSCHGYTGRGGAGARLTQNSITLDAFKTYVRRPKGSMPPFGSQVTDAEFADIYAFLKSMPPSPDPKSIPLLNQDK